MYTTHSQSRLTQRNSKNKVSLKSLGSLSSTRIRQNSTNNFKTSNRANYGNDVIHGNNLNSITYSLNSLNANSASHLSQNQCVAPCNNTDKTSVKALLKSKFHAVPSGKSSELNYGDIYINNSRETYFTCCQIVTEKKCTCYISENCVWIDKWWRLSQWSHSDQIARKGEQVQDSIKKQIEKDMSRTPFVQNYVDRKAGERAVRNMLVQYAATDPEVGYVQGFNIIASTIVSHCKNERKGKDLLIFVLRNQKLRKLYLNDFQKGKELASKIKLLLRDPIWYLFLVMKVSNCQELEVFILGWILPLFGNIVPIEYMHLIVDGYLDIGWNFIAHLTVSLFLYLKEELMDAQAEEVMEKLTSHQLKKTGIDWEELVAKALHFPV